MVLRLLIIILWNWTTVVKGHGAFTSTRVTPLPAAVLSEDHMKVIAPEDVAINFADDEWILRIDVSVEGIKGPINY